MAEFSSHDAWYFGHATPDELRQIVVAQETDEMWEQNPILDPTVAQREAKEAYSYFTYSTPQHLRDDAADKVTSSTKPHGEDPVSEKYTVQYLDDLIAKAEWLIEQCGLELSPSNTDGSVEPETLVV